MTQNKLTVQSQHTSSGFTLVELVMVIVITGIIGSMVSVFLKWPVQQYMDVARRAELTGIADTALYRLAADVSAAVPNSIRQQNQLSFEFVPVKDGGRYLFDSTGAASPVGDPLTFDGIDKTFDVIGPANIVVGDSILIGSTSSSGNFPYDTGASGVLRSVSAVAGANVTLASGLSYAYPPYRYTVVEASQKAVTYSCEGVGLLDGKGLGSLVRYWGYGFNKVQVLPAALPLNTQHAILADKVSGCVINYNTIQSPDGSPSRLGVLEVTLTLTSAREGKPESITLYQEIHVVNAL
ncbi:MAG: type II secretion system protein [Nitrosomonadales bacterium]|jgi:MSHA biogenesis protein MshO